MYGLQQHRLQRKCSDDLFLTVAKEMRSLQRVAPCLGISDEDIHDLTSDQDSGEMSRKIAALELWKRSKGHEATYLALVQTFLAMNDRQTAEHIVRHAKESKLPVIASHSNNTAGSQ